MLKFKSPDFFIILLICPNIFLDATDRDTQN